MRSCDAAQHPTLGRGYLECGYAPMVELLRYLEANGFTNYIASGGGRDFMRPVSERDVRHPARAGHRQLDRARLRSDDDGGIDHVQGPRPTFSTTARRSRSGSGAASAAGRSSPRATRTATSRCSTSPSTRTSRRCACSSSTTTPSASSTTRRGPRRRSSVRRQRLDGRQHEERLDDGLPVARDDRLAGAVTTSDELCWVPAADVPMGSDAHYPEEAPAHPVAVDGFWIDRYQVTNAAVRRVRRGDGLRDGRRAAARPGRLPRRAGREPPARLAGLHADRGPGGPAPPEPLVDVDAGRLAGGIPDGPASLDRAAARTIRSCTSPTRTPRRTRRGPARRCPPRPSGSSPRAAGSSGAAYVWGDEPEPPGERLANYWHGDFPWRAEPGYGTTRRSARSRPTATASTTWPATSGSGRPTGTRRSHADDAGQALLRARTTRAAGASRELRPRASRSSGSRAGSSRAARSSAPTATACATGRRRAARR